MLTNEQEIFCVGTFYQSNYVQLLHTLILRLNDILDLII